MATNLIQVKPYHFFQHTGDINAPPGMSKHELDGKGVDFTDLEEKAKKVAINKQTKAAVSKGIAKAADDQSSANETEDGDSAQAEAKGENDVPKTPEHIIDENAEVVEDYSPESAGGDDNIPDKVDEATTEPERATPEQVSASSVPSNETEAANAGELTDENATESVTDKPDPVIKGPSEVPGDDNLIEIEDPDDYLLYLEAILMKIHKRFYEYYDEHKQVLAVCTSFAS